MKRSLSQFADDALPRPHAHQEMGSFTMAVGISEARTAMACELLVDLRRPELGAFLADAAPETTGADPEAMRSALSRLRDGGSGDVELIPDADEYEAPAPDDEPVPEYEAPVPYHDDEPVFPEYDEPVPERGDGGGAPRTAHRAVLAARSPYFAAMLGGGLREGRARRPRVRLHDLDGPTLDAFLDYCYSGTVPVDAATVAPLLEFCDRVGGAASLARACAAILTQHVDASNAAGLAELAERVGARGLRERCAEALARAVAPPPPPPPVAEATRRGTRAPEAWPAVLEEAPPGSELMTLIVCDGCEAEVPFEHTGLELVPAGEWFCAHCVSQMMTARPPREAEAQAAAPAPMARDARPALDRAFSPVSVSNAEAWAAPDSPLQRELGALGHQDLVALVELVRRRDGGPALLEGALAELRATAARAEEIAPVGPRLWAEPAWGGVIGQTHTRAQLVAAEILDAR